MEIRVQGKVVEWRGPAPYYFVPLGHDEADAIADIAPLVSYGWGCVPLAGHVGSTDFTTALIPRGDTYMLPLKADVRRREKIEPGDVVTVDLTIDESR